MTKPRLRSGVPDSQLKTNGASVSGTSRTSRSSRIHDQLLVTVVRRTAGGLIRVIDDVLDGFALGRDGPDGVLQDGLMIGMVRVGGQTFFVAEVSNQREIGVAILDAEIAPEPVSLDTGDLGGQLMQGSLDLGNILGGGLGFPAEKNYVTQHRVSSLPDRKGLESLGHRG